MKTIKRAIVSVFDKTGIIEFVKNLSKMGIEILSTGGTGSLLEKNGINYIKISEYTNSPEMFDGRVKTLHPRIEGGILYRRNNQKDKEEAETYRILPIDMVVCNLYPFEDILKRPNITLDEALEMIDIGGPTMIRAAAKNFKEVVVVPHPKFYTQIIEELKESGAINDSTRVTLAREVFNIMAQYNMTIANFLTQYFNPNKLFPDRIIKIYDKVQDCSYGENWDQSAAFYQDLNSSYGLNNLKKIHGKEVSFNNYLDIDSCLQMLLDFNEDRYLTAIMKHTTPNGVAIDGTSQLISVQMAFSTDPLSAFGGVWGFNKELQTEVADFLINKKNIFIEVLMAPSFEENALRILRKKEKMRIIAFNDLLERKEDLYKNYEMRSVLGGVLLQEYDIKPIIKEWKVVSKKQVTNKEKDALIFAYRISKWAKSNSACFAQMYDTGIYTLGIGSGQQSRVHVVKLAAQKAHEFGHIEAMKGSFMGTDSFFPFPDGLEASVEAGARAIINPGGSMRDDLVIQRANDLGCALVFCGKRVFKH